MAPIDQVARDAASSAQARISTHEEVCAEIRNQEAIWRAETRNMISSAIADLRATNEKLGRDMQSALQVHAESDARAQAEFLSALKPLYGRFWSLAIGLIVGLFAVAGFLVVKVLNLA